MIERYVDAMSTYAADIDSLVWLITILVGFWFILCELVFFYFILRFREKKGVKSQYITGEEKVHHRWISWPHMLVLVCDVFIVVGAIRVWYDVKQHMPETEETVRIVAQQWAWSFVHAGADGELDTEDDIKTVDELHIQVGKTYKYELQSRDVLHSFSVPVFRLKQDTIPGRIINGWFEATATGVRDIQCTEICGIGHGIMAAKIHIESPEQHAAWIAEKTPIALAANTPR